MRGPACGHLRLQQGLAGEVPENGAQCLNLKGSILAWTQQQLPLVDPSGQSTREVHVWGRDWALQGHGYNAVTNLAQRGTSAPVTATHSSTHARTHSLTALVCWQTWFSSTLDVARGYAGELLKMLQRNLTWLRRMLGV